MTELWMDGASHFVTPQCRTPQRRLLPPRWLGIAYLAGLPVIAWAWQTDAFFDAMIGNVICWVVTFLMLVSGLVWFAFFSGYSRTFRSRSLLLLTMIGLSAVVMWRPVGTNGSMTPNAFAWRWSSTPDAQLAAASKAFVAETSSEPLQADLLTVTPHDFPQFRGITRDGSANGPQPAPAAWQLLWQQPIGAGWSGFVVVHGFAVTMEQRGTDELVTCYRLSDGQLIWSHAVPTRHETFLGGIGPRATPAIAAGNVVALGATGILRCLDGATGKLRWQHDLPARYGHTPEQESEAIAWGRANSPLVVDDRIVIPVGGAPQQRKSLAAFSLLDGQLIWEAGDYQVSYSSPTLAAWDGVRQVIAVTEDHVVAHALDDGKLLWEYPWPGRSNANANVSQPVLLPDQHVWLSKGYGGGAMLLKIQRQSDTWQVEKLYHHPQLMRTKFTNVCVEGDFIYGLDDGILSCVDWRQGVKRWKQGRYGHGQVLKVAGQLLVQSENGEVLWLTLSPDKPQVVQRLPAISGKTWNNPALFDRFLLVRNDQAAACYQQTPQATNATNSGAGPPNR